VFGVGANRESDVIDAFAKEPVSNGRIAAALEEIADLLEIEDENAFRVRAYRHGARVVRGSARGFADMVALGEDLADLPGIGTSLAEKIEELVRTGRLAYLDQVEGRTAPGLRELLGLPGLGPRKVKALRDGLGITTLEQLESAVMRSRVRGVPGFGAKTEARILASLEHLHRRPVPHVLWPAAEPLVLALTRHMERIPGVTRVAAAGDYRRLRETVDRIELLVAAGRDARATERLLEYEGTDRVVSRSAKRVKVVLRNGLSVDLHMVPARSFGAALFAHTGSDDHVATVRRFASKQGLALDERGVFRGDARIAGRTERELYESVGLGYIEPELREDRGEVEAARAGALPELLTVADIRGDLHVHTSVTNGRDSPRAMVDAAAEHGYEYVAITEHTASARVSHGLDAERMARHLDRIELLNDRQDRIRILKSAEVDILKDGSLDLPRRILDRLDFTVCAIHSYFDLSAAPQTERILRAMDDPHLSILAHPTGRLIDRRDPYAVDFERILAAAAERHCALEINAQPERCDLSDVLARAARDAGVALVVATDAHRKEQLDFMRLGVGQARRAWLTAHDVLNTRSWKDLERFFAQRRR